MKRDLENSRGFNIMNIMKEILKENLFLGKEMLKEKRFWVETSKTIAFMVGCFVICVEICGIFGLELLNLK